MGMREIDVDRALSYTVGPARQRRNTYSEV